MVSSAPLAARIGLPSAAPKVPCSPNAILPMIELPVLPKETEKPKSTHSTVTMPMVTMLIISMFSTDLARVMPP